MFCTPNEIYFNKTVQPKDSQYRFMVTERYANSKDFPKEIFANYYIFVPADKVMWVRIDGKWYVEFKDNTFQVQAQRKESLDMTEMIIYPAFEV